MKLNHYISFTDKQEYIFLQQALTQKSMHLIGAAALIHAITTQQSLALVPLILLFAAALTIDAKHMILPDILTIPALILGLIVAPISFSASLIGAATGLILFAALEITMTRTLGRPALGWGDVKLLAAIGAWGGILALPLTLLMASVAAIHFILYRRLKHKIKNDPFPFGPFLIVGGWLAITHGTQIWAFLSHS